MMKESKATVVAIISMILGAVITSNALDVKSAPTAVIILVWMFFSFTPAILYSIYIEERSNDRSSAVREMADSFLMESGMTAIDENSGFSLDTSHSCISVLPVKDKGGSLYLAIFDSVRNRRYLIPKGSVVHYRVDVNGQQIAAVGGSFLGFGMIKGRVEAVSSVDVIVLLKDGSYEDICIGRNIVSKEFDDTDRFLTRLGALLTVYS